MRQWIEVINEAQTGFTPEFRRWFGRSKAVDEAGRPLVLYHGTEKVDEDGNIFSAFDLEHASQPGFSFTNNSEIAGAFAAAGFDGTIIPVYLRIENPLVVDASAVTDEEGFHDNDLKDELYWDAMEAGHDGVIIRGLHEQVAVGDEYVVFTAAQVKSAVGNRGSYDPSNPDITA